MKRLSNIPLLPILALLPAFVLTLRAGASILTPLLALAVLLLTAHLRRRKADIPMDTDKLASEVLNDPFAMMTQMRTGQSVGYLPSRRGRLSLWSVIWGGYLAGILMAELAGGYEAPIDLMAYVPYLILPALLMLPEWIKK